MKVSSDFGSDTFLPMLVDICWIYTKGHPGMFFIISLGSLVLFKDSKTMVRFYGPRNFELFQCSAEGWSRVTVNGAKVPCLGSTSFQITYDGQTTNVLALVTTALSKEIVLSWRALQRLKVLPEDFPRAQTTVKANQIQSTTKKAVTAKDASKNDSVDLQEAMENLKKKYASVFQVGDKLKTMTGPPMKIETTS